MKGKEKNISIEFNESTEEIILINGGNRTVLTPEFQEEIYEIVRVRRTREILKQSELISSVTDDEEIIEQMIPFYLYRQDKSNVKDSEDFCWLAINDYDHEKERAAQEEEDSDDDEILISQDILE